MSDQQTEFADFFRTSWQPCLRAVVTVAGSTQLAEDQGGGVRKGVGVVADGQKASGTPGVGGTHRAELRGVVVAATCPGTAAG